jgi:hypothetical protein
MKKINLGEWDRWFSGYRDTFTYSDNATLIRCLTLIAILTIGEPDLLDALIRFVDRLAT